MKTCLIKQPAGIGDIFALQKIVHMYLNFGFIVIYPVLPQLLYINDYIQHPNLKFIDINSKFEHRDLYMSTHNTPCEIDECHYLPFDHACMTQPGCVIRAKYNLIGVDWTDWSDYLVFNRNLEKEDKLFYEILGLTDNINYNLINKLFGTQPGSFIKHEVKSNNNLTNVDIRYIDGYTIFDWCKVIERASNIFTVDTALLFLIEKLTLNSKELHMWARFDDYTSITGLFNKDWIYN
tara:strand:+ start:4820 stop:5527 length:708 start_codon:yes stop_codon:yes gene_type:complete